MVMSVQLNERYSKLLADYYITRGLIMVSDNPKEMYKATLNLLNELIDEIDPTFFADHRVTKFRTKWSGVQW